MDGTETTSASEAPTTPGEGHDRRPLLLLVALIVVFVIVCAQAIAAELRRTSSAVPAEPRPSAAPRGPLR